MGRARCWTAERLAEVYAAYCAENVSLRELAKRHGATGEPLHRALRRAGYVLRNRGGWSWNTRVTPFPDERKARLPKIGRGEHQCVTLDGQCIGCEKSA